MSNRDSTNVVFNIMTVLASIVNLFLGAFALLFMWNWFVVGVGFPEISYGLAFGLSIFFSLIRLKMIHSVTTPADRCIIVFSYTVAYGFLILLGWITHSIIS